MAKVMVIAGGEWQCPIVKTAKKMGHYVICTNLFENSPAFQYADVGLIADVLDKEKNLEIAKKYNADAVLTDQTDIAVPTVAYVAEKLGLKGIGTDIAERFTNKYKMREFTLKAGIPTPRYRLCYTAEDAADFLEDVALCIIKPIDSQSSRGIHIVRTKEDVDKYFDDCIQYSNGDKAILIEEFIEGPEFTVDGIKTSKEYIVTAISEKDHYKYNPNVANRLVFTRHNDKYNYERLKKENAEMIDVMAYPFGLTHTEYKYRNGKFYLMETAARGGGTKISSDIVRLVSGINCNELYMNILTNGSDKIIKAKEHECALLGFFDFKPGLITEIAGIDEARSQEGVHDLKLELKVGDQLKQAQDDRSRCGYYILSADSVDELNHRERRLKKTIKVTTKS